MNTQGVIYKNGVLEYGSIGFLNALFHYSITPIAQYVGAPR